MGNPISQFMRGYNSVKKEQNDKKANTIKVVIPSQQTDKNREAVKTGVKAIGRGLTMVGKSLSTPSTNKRPRIAQMPGKRSDMDIVRNASLSRLKMNGMENRDIRGRKIR